MCIKKFVITSIIFSNFMLLPTINVTYDSTKNVFSAVAYAQTAQEHFKRGIGHMNSMVGFDSRLINEAISEFTKAIDLNSNYTMAYIYRGLAYQNLAEAERGGESNNKALRDFNKAIEISPNSAAAYNARASFYLIYHDVNHIKSAISDFTTAIKIDSTDSSNYIGRAEAYYRLDNYQQAIKDCTKAIEINPRDDGAYVQRAKIHYELKNYKKVIYDCTKAIEIDPENTDAYELRGDAYNGLEEYEKADADWDMSRKLMGYNDEPVDEEAVYNALRKLNEMSISDK